MDEEKISELRTLRNSGMVSAAGDYTPPELWEALDCIERLRSALRQIQHSANDSHPTAIWMQKVAAHALNPQWPEPPPQPPSLT